MTTLAVVAALTIALPADLHDQVRAVMARMHVPGAALVIVSGDETVVHTYGVADIASERAVQPDTPFGLQSTAKLLTGLLALELEAEKRISLDADVNTYLTSFKVPSHPAGPITLWHLLTHTGGFDERGIGVAARSAGSVQPLGSYLARDLPRRVRAPGLVAGYSNHGFALAGLTMQEATGVPFEQLIERYLTRPLNLRGTTFAQPLPDDLRRRAASGYMRRGGLMRVDPILFNDFPASALWSTPNDIAVLLRALMDGSRPRWRPALEPVFRNHPRLPGIGLGGAVESNQFASTTWRHGGDWQDFFNLVLCAPDRRLGIFIVSNNGEADEFGRAVLDLLAPPVGLTRPPATESRASVTMASGDIAGTYRSVRHARDGIEKIGLLTGAVPEYEVTANPAVLLNGRPLQAVEADVFTTATGEVVAIRRDATGAAAFLARAATPALAFERTPWLRSAKVQRTLFALMLALFTARLLWMPARRRRPSLAEAAVATHVAFAIGLATIIASIDQWEFQYGAPILVRLWLVVPWLASAAGVAALVKRQFTWAIATLAFSALLWEWNLLTM